MSKMGEIITTANGLLIGTFGGTPAMPWLETFGGHIDSPRTVSHLMIPGTHPDDCFNPNFPPAAPVGWPVDGIEEHDMRTGNRPDTFLNMSPRYYHDHTSVAYYPYGGDDVPSWSERIFA